jgi:hypothetical protein
VSESVDQPKVLKLKCDECGAPDAALEPVWGAHHGRFRVSLYICEGSGTTQGCGRQGVLVADHDTDQLRTYGTVEIDRDHYAPVEDGSSFFG